MRHVRWSSPSAASLSDFDSSLELMTGRAAALACTFSAMVRVGGVRCSELQAGN